MTDLRLGISDDDLCASCKNLDYHPGEKSLCKFVTDNNPFWMAIFDEDGYARYCVVYKKEQVNDYIHP